MDKYSYVYEHLKHNANRKLLVVLINERFNNKQLAKKFELYEEADPEYIQTYLKVFTTFEELLGLVMEGTDEIGSLAEQLDLDSNIAEIEEREQRESEDDEKFKSDMYYHDRV